MHIGNCDSDGEAAARLAHASQHADADEDADADEKDTPLADTSGATQEPQCAQVLFGANGCDRVGVPALCTVPPAVELAAIAAAAAAAAVGGNTLSLISGEPHDEPL